MTPRSPVQRIAIVDYGMGNLHSVKKKFDRIGASTVVTSDPGDLARADKLVLPGVGHFGKAMENLAERTLIDAMNEAVRVNRTPILGICLGMQLFAKQSEEGNARGLGWIDADVVRFRVDDTLRFKVPHMGWNGASAVRPSPLLEGMTPRTEFYFVHSYHVVCHDPADVLCDTDYAYRFTSMIQRENVFGVQFHPEKSHDAGEALLKNFVYL